MSSHPDIRIAHDERLMIGAVRGLQRSLTVFLTDAIGAAQESYRLASDVITRIAADVNELARRRDQSAKGKGGTAEADRAARRLASAEEALRAAKRALARCHARQTRAIRATQRIVAEDWRVLDTIASELEKDGGGVPPAPAGGAGLSLFATGLPSGWQMVPLELIDASASTVSGPSSFTRGYSQDALTWSFQALREVVLPALARGRGADYFKQRDARERRWGAESYGATYRGFFSAGSAINLRARPDGTYAVKNGYHRIWVAAQLALDAVPARVRNLARSRAAQLAVATDVWRMPTDGRLMEPLVKARTRLETSTARRLSAARAVEEAWGDAITSSEHLGMLASLDYRTGELRDALEALDIELARALSAVDS